jgi:hypothetical protein
MPPFSALQVTLAGRLGLVGFHGPFCPDVAIGSTSVCSGANTIVLPAEILAQ